MQSIAHVTYEIADGDFVETIELLDMWTKQNIREDGWSWTYTPNEYVNNLDGSRYIASDEMANKTEGVTTVYITSEDIVNKDICVRLETEGGAITDSCNEQINNAYVSISAISPNVIPSVDFTARLVDSRGSADDHETLASVWEIYSENPEFPPVSSVNTLGDSSITSPDLEGWTPDSEDFNTSQSMNVWFLNRDQTSIEYPWVILNHDTESLVAHESGYNSVSGWHSADSGIVTRFARIGFPRHRYEHEDEYWLVLSSGGGVNLCQPDSGSVNLAKCVRPGTTDTYNTNRPF